VSWTQDDKWNGGREGPPRHHRPWHDRVPGPRSEERGATRTVRVKPLDWSRRAPGRTVCIQREDFVASAFRRTELSRGTEEAFPGFWRLESVGPRAPDAARRDRCRGGSGTARRVRDRTP